MACAGALRNVVVEKDVSASAPPRRKVAVCGWGSGSRTVKAGAGSGSISAAGAGSLGLAGTAAARGASTGTPAGGCDHARKARMLRNTESARTRCVAVLVVRARGAARARRLPAMILRYVSEPKAASATSRERCLRASFEYCGCSSRAAARRLDVARLLEAVAHERVEHLLKLDHVAVGVRVALSYGAAFAAR